MLELPVRPCAGAAADRVLNAFRHLICWNQEGPFVSAGSVGVLNAFRHLICWNSRRVIDEPE